MGNANAGQQAAATAALAKAGVTGDILGNAASEVRNAADYEGKTAEARQGVVDKLQEDNLKHITVYRNLINDKRNLDEDKRAEAERLLNVIKDNQQK